MKHAGATAPVVLDGQWPGRPVGIITKAETERLLSPGAWKLAERPGDRMRWATFADIEGNEFDLIAG
jgi:hypothetical protein